MNLTLTPAQHEKALAVAAELRISEADAVERALDLVLLMRGLLFSFGGLSGERP